MEMIAMLGGLGSSALAPLTTDAARATMGAIEAAKDVGAINAIIDALPKMGLSQAELLTLQNAAIDKREALFTPFYKRPMFWVGLGVAGLAWAMRDQIKGAFRLSGWSRENPNYDFAAGEEKARRMSDVELHYALLDIRKTLPGSRALDREDGGGREGWYMDEASVYQREWDRRRKGSSGLGGPLPKSTEGIDKQGRKIRLTLKKTDPYSNEWQVRVYVNGKFNEDKTYFASDKADALATLESMQKHYGLGGLSAGGSTFFSKSHLNPRPRSRTPAARAKAGYSRGTWDPYAQQKSMEQRYSDAAWHARQKAKGLRRKARTEARKAGK